MERENILDRIKKDLRSVLISAPRGVPVRMLIRDFRTVLGYELPYRQLGFQAVESFISTVPDVVRLASGVTGEITCFAVADKSTSQIARFVASQKKPKIKKFNAPPLVRKPVFSGFTKKSRYGPRPRTQGGSRSGGSGNITTGESYGGSRQYKSNYGRENRIIPPRFRGNQQWPRQSSSSPSMEPVRSPSIPSKSTSHNSTTSSTSRIGDSVSSSGTNSSPSMSIPEQRVHSGAVSYSSRLWDPNLPRNKKCLTITIHELGDRARTTKFKDMSSVVCTVGYIATPKRQDANMTKYLLHSGYDGELKHGFFPALMLFFRDEAWEHEREVQNIPIGSKLRVIGAPLLLQSKSKGVFEPALKVHHWSYEHNVSSSPGSSVKSTPPHTLPQLSPPNNEIKKLIYDLLKAKPSGVWSKRFGKQFQEFHKFDNFDPPSDILEIAMSLPFVMAEDGTTEDNFIVMLKAEASYALLTTPTEVPSSQRYSKSREETTKATVTYSAEKPSLPGTVDLASTDYFDVYVIYVNNPISFYLQRTGEGYSDKLLTMHEEMSRYFSRNRVRPLIGVEVDGLYGYQWEKDFWCRVLVSSLSEDKAVVYFPDYGSSEEVKWNDLMDLPREFYQLPFQAVHCCLHGCNSVREEASKLFAENALDKNCVAQVMDSSGTRIAVELIDSESDSGDTINSIILSALHPLDTLCPQLPDPGDSRVPVILTDVDEDGIITVQLCGPGMNRLQNLMTVINEKYKKSVAADFLKSVDIGKVYCTQFPVDKKFYRVIVKKALPGKILVEYVDYGNEDQTEIQKLRKPLSNPLFKLPFQAVKCRLSDISSRGEWSEGITHFLATFMECEDLYLTVVNPGGRDCLPSVKLIISSGEDDVVLNDMIQQGFEMSGVGNSYSASANLDAGSGGGTTSLPTTPNVLPEIPTVTGANQKSRSLSVPDTGVFTSEHGGSVMGSNSPENARFEFKFSDKGFEGSAPVNYNNPLPSSTSQANVSNVTLTTKNACNVITPSPQSTGQLTPLTPKTSPSIITPSSPQLISAGSSSGTSQTSTPGLVPYSPSSSYSSTNQAPNSPSHVPPPVPHTPQESPSSDCFSPPKLLASNFSFAPVSSCGAADLVEFSAHKGSSLLSSDAGNKYSYATLSCEIVEAVNVSWVESPQNFVVNLLSQTEALMKMTAKLNKIMTSVFSSHVFIPKLIKENLICCAQSVDYHSWYRVRLVSVGNSSIDANFDVTVEYLDYGGTEVVNNTMLRTLPDEMVQFPFQGIRCTLKGVEPLNPTNPREWSEDSLKWFNNCALEVNFYAIELDRDDGRSCVTLLDTSEGEETVDVRNVLKEAGFATLWI